MKRILYPVVLFVMISQHAIAQCITDCKQKIILTFYKTEYCSSDMERNYISAVESDRFNSADSISYVAENTLVLYKNKEVIDTLFLKGTNIHNNPGAKTPSLRSLSSIHANLTKI